MNSSKKISVNVKIPKEFELTDRFYNTDDVMMVDVDYIGFIKEIDACAPFRGYASVRQIINMLNRDINVNIDDINIVKMRNSIVYFNEYFCPSEDNIQGFKPAYVAFDRIESKYLRVCKEVEFKSAIKNPFVNDVFRNVQFYENAHTTSDVDDALSRYMAEQAKNRKSANKTLNLNNPPDRRNIVTMHSEICSRVFDRIDLNEFEKCFEDCEFNQ